MKAPPSGISAADRASTPRSAWFKLTTALTGLALAVTIVVAPVTAARADVPLLRDNYYELGPIYQTGGVSLGGYSATLSGLHIQERNGFFGKALWTVLVATLMALGQTDREYLGSTYGPGYRIDYYRMKSPEELAADARARDAAIDGTAANDYQTDLYIIWPMEGLGDTRGYIFETYPFSFNLDAATFDIGFGFSHLRSKCGKDKNGGVGRCDSDGFTMPIRVGIDVASIAIIDLQLTLNFLAFGDDTSTTTYSHDLRAGVTLHPWQRLFVRGSVTVPDFDFDDMGIRLEAGLRF